VALHVTSGKYWDDRRNTSRARAPDPENTRQFIAACRRARERREHWVLWIDAGCPELTVEEYQRVSPQGAKRAKRQAQPASA
jgi:hypothetical protein